MSLSSHQLDAFLTVAQTRGFSSAAMKLNMTQSALSQRIKNLEEDLGLTLFLRTPEGAVLTEQGERLLRYCQTRDSLETELIQELNGIKASKMSGTIRLAAYSSVLRSVIFPILQPFLEKHPQILCNFICADMEELPGLLQRNVVDFIVMDYKLDRANLETAVLGQEKYVLIESRTKSSDRDLVFLDNDFEDRATENFLKAQGRKSIKYKRSYFADCYGIIDGVAAGFGKAVMPEHLVVNHPQVKISKEFKPYNVDVVLHYYQQPFYSQIHKAILETLMAKAHLELG